MRKLDELYGQISELSEEERKEFVAVLMARFGGEASQEMSLLTGIEHTEGVCGGDARIVRTRIPVWALEQMRRLGQSDADILRSYPTLRAEDLIQAWRYVASHRGEIDAQIDANERA